MSNVNQQTLHRKYKSDMKQWIYIEEKTTKTSSWLNALKGEAYATP